MRALRVGARGGRPSRPAVMRATAAMLAVAVLLVGAVTGGVAESREGRLSFGTTGDGPGGAVPASIRSGGPLVGGPESASNGTEPAPMGLADLGSSSGPFGGALRTLSFRASAAIGNVSSFNGSLGSSATAFSLQLNAFLQFEDQATQYVYWVQDVAEVDSATRDVSFLDNVWNASSISIAASALSGNGSVSGSGSSSYYGFAPACTPSTCYVLPRPGTIALALNASTSSGTPTVRFEIGSGGGFSTYDTVSFPWATEVTSFSGFEVNSSLWDDGACPRCYGDVEWVLGGPGDGYQTNLDGATGITLALDWWNGGNYEAVPSAVDYGISTAEGIGRTTVAAVGGPSDDPEANLSWGGGELHPLWAPSALSVIEVTDRTSSADGSYTVNGSTAAFDGSAIGLSLRPGPVSFSVDCNGTTFSFGTLSLEAGEVLTLEVGALPVVFVPHGLPTSDVWSVTLAGMRLNGTGNLTFGEPAGVYAYTVTSLAGYSASPSAGNVTVGVPGANVTVQFRATPSAIAGLEQLLAQYLPLLLLGVVVVAIAAIGFAVARRHGQHISSARPIRPAAPIAGVCPHCGAPLPAGPAPCGRCGWRRPPGA